MVADLNPHGFAFILVAAGCLMTDTEPDTGVLKFLSNFEKSYLKYHQK